MVGAVPLGTGERGASKDVDGFAVGDGDGPEHAPALTLSAQRRKHFHFEKIVLLQDIDPDRFIKGIAEVEGDIFFESSEDGIVLDKLFDFEVRKMLVKVSELFYLSLSLTFCCYYNIL